MEQILNLAGDVARDPAYIVLVKSKGVSGVNIKDNFGDIKGSRSVIFNMHASLKVNGVRIGTRRGEGHGRYCVGALGNKRKTIH
jgi:hypothetical protein